MKILIWIKSLLRSDIVGQPLVATVLALIFAPFSIYMGFEITGRLSRPIISIEYVTKYEEKTFLDALELEQRASKLMESSLFNRFKFEKFSSFLSYDFTFLIKKNDKQKLVSAIFDFRNYIHLEQSRIQKSLKELPNKDIIDKRILASQILSIDEDIVDENLEQRLSFHLSAKLKEMQDLLNQLNGLEQQLHRSSVINIMLNLSILNKGSTDGLVRNIGFLTYNKIKFRIKKIPPPKNESDLLAVPTYVVNKSFGLYSENAIGKIQKNTMSEFWFFVDEKNTKGTICDKGGFYSLELFDQDKRIIRKKFPCN